MVRGLLLLLAAALAGCATPPAPPPALAPDAPAPVLLVSIDGFHPQWLDWGLSPTLARLAERGTRARWMRPSYPTLTFPNHYSLVTGLRPDRHGIIHNNMADPELGRFAMYLREAVMDGRWWGGEPIWVTLERLGEPTATMFWPGSEAPVGGVQPRHWHAFDREVTPRQRVEQALAWLDLPPGERPRFITLYFEDVDHYGHRAGVGTPEHRAAIARIDGELARLLRGLARRGLDRSAHLVVTSDHGMAPVDGTRLVMLDELVDLDAVEVHAWGTLAQLDPLPGHEADVERSLVGEHEDMTCFRRDDMPKAWHYGRHPRVPAITCQADAGATVVSRGWLERRGRPPDPGAHGYAPEDPAMRALFIAAGPRIPAGRVIEPFDNVHVHALLAELLGVADAVPRGLDADPAFAAGLLRPSTTISP